MFIWKTSVVYIWHGMRVCKCCPTLCMLYIFLQDSCYADDNRTAAKRLSWNYCPVMLSKPWASMMRTPWWKWSLGLLRKPKPCHLTCHAWPNTKYGVTSASTLSKGWQKEKDCVKASDLKNQNSKQTSVQLKKWREVNDMTFFTHLTAAISTLTRYSF